MFWRAFEQRPLSSNSTKGKWRSNTKLTANKHSKWIQSRTLLLIKSTPIRYECKPHTRPLFSSDLSPFRALFKRPVARAVYRRVQAVCPTARPTGPAVASEDAAFFPPLSAFLLPGHVLSAVDLRALEEEVAFV